MEINYLKRLNGEGQEYVFDDRDIYYETSDPAQIGKYWGENGCVRGANLAELKDLKSGTYIVADCQDRIKNSSGSYINTELRNYVENDRINGILFHFHCGLKTDTEITENKFIVQIFFYGNLNDYQFNQIEQPGIGVFMRNGYINSTGVSWKNWKVLSSHRLTALSIIMTGQDAYDNGSAVSMACAPLPRGIIECRKYCINSDEHYWTLSRNIEILKDLSKDSLISISCESSREFNPFIVPIYRKGSSASVVKTRFAICRLTNLTMRIEPLTDEGFKTGDVIALREARFTETQA